ncbi:MAG: CaiB/BaiF CoA-transferase family protein [Sheuella sp.]|nr:CaiB/BaiF CoA-transferase family protein [Sheuella sp.]
MAGPLQGVKIIEMAGLGPAPFACMLLADLGAEVICIDRPMSKKASPEENHTNILRRGKKSIVIDMKRPAAVQTVLSLIAGADVLIEGFRPGVMERLGLGPEICMAQNPALVFGRMTGWGQNGPLSQAAGHDINYIALSGALHAVGTAEQPIVPLNLVGDFGGGAMLLVAGVLSALIHARSTGRGQVVDAAMTDGSALLMSMMYGFMASGQWKDQRASNMLDGGAHFYGTYQCSDGKWVAIGSIEPQFYALLIEKSGLKGVDMTAQRNPATWPEMKSRLAEVFATRTQSQWCLLMEGTDICFAPVLGMKEAADHPHNIARQTFCEVDGVLQPSPAPRFSHTASEILHPPVQTGTHTIEVLGKLGLSEAEINALGG